MPNNARPLAPVDPGERFAFRITSKVDEGYNHGFLRRYPPAGS